MGLKKTLLYAGGLAVATGGPVTMYTASDVASSVRKGLSSTPAVSAAATPGQNASGTAATASTDGSLVGKLTAVDPGPLSLPVDVNPVASLYEVLRFDVTVEWVMQRWPRVSTGMPHLQLQGYRVPLVSGTSMGDVAGSLTYYFNAAQRVQRITLKGTTGDPAMLVGLLANQHHFTRRLTNDPGVVLYEAVDSNSRPAGTLMIRSAKVVKAYQPYTRFEVDLTMDRAE